MTTRARARAKQGTCQVSTGQAGAPIDLDRWARELVALLLELDGPKGLADAA